MFILYWIPKNLLSAWVGKLMHIPWPQFFNRILIQQFIRLYRIRLEEAEKPIEAYQSVGDFFTRKLKEGVRPLGATPYVHPADSQMTARGVILAQQLVQAKGRTYPLETFLQEAQTDRWKGGFFVTYYLCPTDYHRVHSPITGVIREVRYVPGALWPVNDWSVQTIPQLFVQNERVIVEIEAPQGPLAVVFVGATNVGSIRLIFEPTLRTNYAHRRAPRRITYLNPIPIEKGEELGMFCMGSTVIVVASSGWEELRTLTEDQIPTAVNVRAPL